VLRQASEGLPVPRERALLVERSQDGESESSIERAQGRMPVASVRRRGMGSPSRKVAKKGTQVENLCYERRSARRPRPVGFHVPAGIGYPVNR